MLIDDYDAVFALWQSCDGLGDLEPRDEFARFLARNPGLSVVARRGERLVGAVLCGHDGRRAFLYHLAVAIDCRGQGVAAAIVARCLEKLAVAGIPRCSVHLYTDNAAGRTFWQRLGWRERTDLKVFAQDISPPTTSPANSPHD